MYRSPLFNKALIPALSTLSLAYAVYATGVMRPATVSLPPLFPPPERAFEHTVAAVGIVEPASELIAIAPRVPGWIETVHVTAGQRVEAGEPLFTLDGTDLRAELALRREAVGVVTSRLDRLRASPRPEDVPIAAAQVAEAKARLEDTRNNLHFVDSVTDRRAISEELLSQRRQAVAREEALLAARQAEYDRLIAGAWKEDIAVAEHEVAQAQAAVRRTEADIERLTTRAPIAANILRLTARPGQYASAAVSDEPLATIGSPAPLHVRADINEADIPRINVGARAAAIVRGGTGERIELEFVRLEPLVTPKRALSGFATERVDTRVMQAIFRLGESATPVFVGQQVDIYIDAIPSAVTLASNSGSTHAPR